MATNRKTMKLMPGFKKRQNLNKGADQLQQFRMDVPGMYVKNITRAMAQRIARSREIFPWKFFRGDCHAHTLHSDGSGTVAEVAEMVAVAELDFQYVTDHWGVTQAPECRRHGLWVGQEPATEHHHMGVLGLEHAFEPIKDLLADVKAARALGATVFIPHPAGWWPRTVYSDEQKQSLFQLPAPFLMEVINGAGNLVRAFDYTDQAAVELWDRLLMAGRRVHAMGNTDAHIPLGIGIAWNGVFAAKCDQASILRALSAGKSFASEAPLLHLAIGKTTMGGKLSRRTGDESVEVNVVDSGGLATVNLVADGKVRQTWQCRNQPALNRKVKLLPSWKYYVRIEAISTDGHRGFSNPIYLPAGQR